MKTLVLLPCHGQQICALSTSIFLGEGWGGGGGGGGDCLK